MQSIASSIGVAVFGSAFFHTIATDSPEQAYQQTLLIQVGLLVVFLLLTFLFPKKGRPDEFATVGDGEDTTAAASAAPATGATTPLASAMPNHAEGERL